MTPTQDGARQAPPGLTSLFLLRLALLAVLIAATVALASTRLAEAAPPLQVATSACEPDPLALPPGHPRVFGRAWPGGQLALPPGHPPIDGPAARFARPVPPLAPTFEAPGTLDI